MTEDEISAMAKAAGMSPNEDPKAINALGNSVPLPWLAQFATSVAAKEREACAQVVLKTAEWRSPGWVSTICPITKQAIAAAIRARPE